jgi:hypothetical protein
LFYLPKVLGSNQKATQLFCRVAFGWILKPFKTVLLVLQKALELVLALVQVQVLEQLL